MGRNDKDRDDLLRAIVIGYTEPLVLFAFHDLPNWYEEGKIIYSDKLKAIGYCNGCKVNYKVVAYKFRRILDNPKSIETFLQFIRNNPNQYPGAHHVNLYFGVSRKFKTSIKIFDL